MRKILFYILSINVLITCTNDAFEEETEAPVVLFELVVPSGEGGTVNSTGHTITSVLCMEEWRNNNYTVKHDS